MQCFIEFARILGLYVYFFISFPYYFSLNWCFLLLCLVFMAPCKALFLEKCDANEVYCYYYYTHTNEESAI